MQKTNSRLPIPIYISTPALKWNAAPILATLLSGLPAGCVSDAELLKENMRIAIQTAEQRAATDLGCPHPKSKIVRPKEVPGIPLGELYSEYDIQVTGCGKQISYAVECRDQSVCSTKTK